MQDDFVAVSGQFVVQGAPLEADVDGADEGGVGREAGEEARIDQEFVLRQHRMVHGGAQSGGVRPRAASGEARRGVQRVQRAQAAHVPDHHAPSRGEEPDGLLQDASQIGGVREVLHHRVEDDRVEPVPGKRGHVVGGTGQKAHPVREPGLPDLCVEPLDDRSGEVRAPVLVALRGQL